MNLYIVLGLLCVAFGAAFLTAYVFYVGAALLRWIGFIK